MPGHVHVFIGSHPAMAISGITRDIKNNSSNFINDHKCVKGNFAWQEGYGALLYSYSHIEKVYDYILNEENLHKKKKFKEEYLGFLENLR